MTKNDTGFFQRLIWDLITLNKGLEYVFFWFRIPRKPWIKQRLAENKGLSEKYNIQHWWFNLVKQRFPSSQRCDGINSNVSQHNFRVCRARMSMIPHFTRQRSQKSHTNWFENKGNLLAAPTNSLTSNAAAMNTNY